MPELPEVETTLRGIAPHLCGTYIDRLLVWEHRLRWPVPADTEHQVRGQRILELGRRGKYLLLALERGTILIHLGMSGSLRILASPIPPAKHDHLDLCLRGGQCLRMRDQRRCGAFLWTPEPPAAHPLLAHLGPEPLARLRRRLPLRARQRQAVRGQDLYHGCRSGGGRRQHLRQRIPVSRRDPPGAHLQPESAANATCGWRRRSGPCSRAPSIRVARPCGISCGMMVAPATSCGPSRSTAAWESPALGAAVLSAGAGSGSDRASIARGARGNSTAIPKCR